MLLVVGSGISQDALAAAVARHAPHAKIVFRVRRLAALEDSPLQHSAYLALALGGAAAVGCGLLVLLLSLLLSAPSRQLTLARLSTMGLSAGQGRLIAVLEAVPQLLAVLVGGTATAAALGPLLGPALSLSVFTGSASSVPVRIEPVWLGVAAAGLLVLAIGTLAGQTAVTSHNAARSVRMEG
jgi:putative ABC transport system permease protein